jgi:Transcription factor WhiB
MAWQFSKDLDWMAEAACVGTDGDAFFGGRRGGRPSLRGLPCVRCNVRSECLEHALSSHSDLYGVWGGRAFQGNEERRFERVRDLEGCGSAMQPTQPDSPHQKIG